MTNPGGLYGGKTRENLFDGSSRCRNATLVKLMSIVPLPDGAGSPAEGNGSGIPMMIDAMRAHGHGRAPVPAPGSTSVQDRALPFKNRGRSSMAGS
ncbi:MAG: ATP-binding protein [Collinsella sp.]